MKKGLQICVAIIIVLCIGWVNAPQAVEAKDTKVAEGVWNTGTEVDVDALVPAELNLLTKGVKITKAGLICHPFRGGQFHWVGEIRQLKDSQWVKLPTVLDWVPSTEGVFTACAQAPAAGTFALFGYYNGPLEIARDIPSGNPVDCSTVEWLSALIPVVSEHERFYYFTYFFNIPIGTPVTYRVTNIVPESNFVGALTGNGIITTDGFVNFGTDQYLIRINSSVDSTITTDFSLMGCTFTDVSIRNRLE